MKKVIFLLILSLLVVSLVYSSERIVLGEYFSNIYSLESKTAKDTLKQIASDLGDDFILINYHSSNPSQLDPFYRNNTAANEFRRRLYDASGEYSFMLNGVPVSSSPETWRDSISSALYDSTSVRLELEAESDSLFAHVYSTDSMGDSLTIYFALVESDLKYFTPFQDSIHNNIFKEFLPDTSGIPIVGSDSSRISVHFPDFWEYDLFNCSIIAFLQKRYTKEIVQADKISSLIPEHYFSIRRTDRRTKFLGNTFPSDTMVPFHFTVINGSSTPVTFNLSLSKQGPEDWVTNFCTETGCYPTEGEVSLESAEVETISVDFYPMGTLGEGRATMTVSSSRIPVDDSIKFRLIAGKDRLLVDDDRGDNLETYYISSLDSSDYDYAYYSTVEGPLSIEEYENFESIIWFTGRSRHYVLDSLEVAGLETHLDGGGELLITGQDIARSLSVDYGSSFLENYLNSSLRKDSSDRRTIFGVDDTVTVGIESRIEGGTGADNQGSPDVISPIGREAMPIFYYDSLRRDCAGIKAKVESSRVVFLPFGWEAIRDSSVRNSLLDNSLRWLGRESGIRGLTTEKRSDSLKLLKVTPNPFSDRVQVAYKVGSGNEVEFRIYTVTGDLIEEKSEVAPTRDKMNYFDWEPNISTKPGVNETNGIYIFVLEQGKKRISSKIIHLK